MAIENEWNYDLSESSTSVNVDLALYDISDGHVFTEDLSNTDFWNGTNFIPYAWRPHKTSLAPKLPSHIAEKYR